MTGIRYVACLGLAVLTAGAGCGRHESDFVASGSVDTSAATAWGSTDSVYRASYRGADFIIRGIDTLFGAHVTADRGLVDYDSLYANRLFRSVIDTIGGLNLASLDTYEDSLTFLVNAYNALAIYGIRKFGITRPDENGFRFFNALDFTVAGRTLTLDGLEKNDPDLIARFDDPRIHFVLVCAALGCPPLLTRAYRPDSLYRQFDEQAVRFINNAEFNPILGGATAEVSSIFNWYAADFTGYTRDAAASDRLGSGGTGGVRDYIVSYLAGADSAAKHSRITGTALSYDYDWSLNGQ